MEWKDTPEGKEVLEQAQICSFPNIPLFGWLKRKYEKRFGHSACALHDYEYVKRTGERGERSRLGYWWEEEKARYRADVGLFKNQWRQKGLMPKLWAPVTYATVRLFGWIPWWNLNEKNKKD